jgi:hypothetical protein
MMDIIERLLTRTDYADREEAAGEIERLRNDLAEMQVLLGALDAALDQTLREALGLGKVT